MSIGFQFEVSRRRELQISTEPLDLEIGWMRLSRDEDALFDDSLECSDDRIGVRREYSMCLSIHEATTVS